VNVVPPSRPSRPGPGDPSIRRTWWLLAGAFFVLALISGIRLIVFRQPIDWLIVGLVIVAAIAAIAHRNAVGGLESRGRGEAESFARILRGLSRSVSAEAIVSAIVEDLIDATEADHVVLVRRRPGGAALEATLVTRRSGVPATTTILPTSLLDDEVEGDPGDSVGVAVGPGLGEAVGLAPEAPRDADVSSPELLTDAAVPPADAAGPAADPAAPSTSLASISLPTISRRASDVRGSRTFVRRVAAEALALLHDIGLPTPDVLTDRASAKPSEVLARGRQAAVTERVADRVRAAFGLSHTLTVPLRSVDGVIGAIVLSRRDRGAWPESSRRLLRVAAGETAAALERADSFRAAETSAATDPLTGLPNRRYFNEFSALLAGRRRAGDAVAVLMIDIDKFKGLNDTYGHPTGDQVLRSVAEAITTAVREQDVPARIGGEEFAVVLRNPGPDVAIEIGERVRQAVRDLDLAAIGVPGVSVSVGVANASSADESIQALLDRADQALLRAKRAGRDRVIAG
jgi:diguanylate cyclase (GGDEF)-like protein